ncbi:hypothetical protein NT239_04635 [Chitinibacter sp. SCUT-21]|uniref:hypothetical protein n=1 Tax=Chitinibacter sp. SCUT-21 TaxID=2970891 RepID=UPI0035A5F609
MNQSNSNNELAMSRGNLIFAYVLGLALLSFGLVMTGKTYDLFSWGGLSLAIGAILQGSLLLIKPELTTDRKHELGNVIFSLSFHALSRCAANLILAGLVMSMVIKV